MADARGESRTALQWGALAAVLGISVMLFAGLFALLLSNNLPGSADALCVAGFVLAAWIESRLLRLWNESAPVEHSGRDDHA